MRTHWLPWSLAAAALSFTACGDREEVVVENRVVAPAGPAHGGNVVMLGDARVEVVHDVTTGTVTVYELRGANDRIVAFEQAPVLELRTETGVVPVTLVRVEGQSGAWRATNVVLEKRTLGDVRLVASIEGRRFDEPIAATAVDVEPVTPATPASLPPETPAPTEGTTAPLPTDESAGVTSSRPAERVLSLDGGGTVRLVRDDRAAAFTVRLMDADGKAMAAQRVVLVVSGKENPLSRIEGEPGSWTVSSDLVASADARFVAIVDGKELTGSIPSSWSQASQTTTVDTTTTPPAPAPAAAPDVPADEPKKVDAEAPAEEPAKADAAAPQKVEAAEPRKTDDAAAPKASPAPLELVLEGKGSARFLHDEKAGRVSVELVDAEGKAIAAEKVVLVLEPQGEARHEVTLARVDALTKEWTAADDALKAKVSGRLLVTIDGEQHAVVVEAKTVAPKGAEITPTPGQPSGDAPKPPADQDRKYLPRPDERANPPDPHPEPAGKPGPANPPTSDSKDSEARVALEGHFFLAIAGTSDRLELWHDKNAGSLTVQGLGERGAISFDEAPVLFFQTADGSKQASLNKVEGKPGTWWVLHASLKDTELVGKIRVKANGKAFDVDLAGPRIMAEGAEYHVTLGGERFVVERDATAGMIAVRAGRPSTISGLTFFLRSTEDGKPAVQVELTPVPGQPGTFRATHESFRGRRLEGRFTGRMEGRTVEGNLQGGAQAGANAGAAGSAAGGSGSTGAGAGAGTGSGAGAGAGAGTGSGTGAGAGAGAGTGSGTGAGAGAGTGSGTGAGAGAGAGTGGSR